ncbi:MAG: FAD-dependent monooxygenase, partial [Shimia sp.]
LAFDHAELGEGPLGHLVEDRHLRRALLDAERDEDRIAHLSEVRVANQRVDATGADVTLADGRTLRAPLLIGCDGRRSGTADRAGIRRIGWAYGQSSLVCAVSHERPHGGIAHQLFLPAGPLAILPLTGDRSSVVWTETAATAQRLTDGSDAAYLQALRPRFGSFLGEIDLVGDRFHYPLDLTLAHSFVADRVALVGDAAHGIHPIAGQGLNAGMKDVAALAETLSLARRRGEDIGTAPVLERYQRWRRFDATALALATDTFNRLFSNDVPVLRGLRDLGLGAVSALPVLRRGFMREAAGLGGDLPRLLQGKPV